MANKYLKGIVKKKGDFRTYTETTDETDKLVFTREGSDSQKGHLFFNGQEYGNDPIYEYTWDQPVVTDSTKKYAKIFTVPQYASIVMSFSIEQGTNRGTTDFLVVDDTYLKNMKPGMAAGSQFYTLQIASFFQQRNDYSTNIYFPTFPDNGHFYNPTKIHFKLLYSNVDASQITFASSANPVYMDSTISGSVNDIVGVAKSAKFDTAVSTTFQYQVTTAGTATLDMKTYKDFIGNVDLMTADTKNVQLTFSGTSTTNYNTDSIYRFEFNKKINSLYFINHGSTIASYTSDIYAGDVVSLTPNVGTDSTVTWSIDVKHNSIYPLNDSLTIIKDDTGNFGLKVTDDYYQTTTSSTLNTTTKNVVGAINEVLAEKQDKLTFDTTPTDGSTNPVTSDGLKTALDAITLTAGSGIQIDSNRINYKVFNNSYTVNNDNGEITLATGTTLPVYYYSKVLTIAFKEEGSAAAYGATFIVGASNWSTVNENKLGIYQMFFSYHTESAGVDHAVMNTISGYDDKTLFAYTVDQVTKSDATESAKNGAYDIINVYIRATVDTLTADGKGGYKTTYQNPSTNITVLNQSFHGRLAGVVSNNVITYLNSDYIWYGVENDYVNSNTNSNWYTSSSNTAALSVQSWTTAKPVGTYTFTKIPGYEIKDYNEQVQFEMYQFDTTPTAGSTNPVTSGGLKTALDTKQAVGDYALNSSLENLADGEDLENAVVGGVNVVREKTIKVHDAPSYSGLGRVILRKNMVNGVNVLTKEMINQANTIYEIRYDFDLNGEDITIPEGCTLDFQGGSFGNGSVVGNNTVLKAFPVKIMDCTLQGTFNTPEAYIEWFGGKADNNTDCLQAFNTAVNNFVCIKLLGGTYLVSDTLNIPDYCSIYGEVSTVITTNNDINYLLYVERSSYEKNKARWNDFVIDCNNKANYGIYAKNITNNATAFLQNIEIFNAVTCGLHLETCQLINLYNVLVRSSADKGIVINGCNNARIYNISAIQCEGDGITLTKTSIYSGHLYIFGIYSENNKGNGVYIDNINYGMSLISGGWIEGNAKDGVYIDNSTFLIQGLRITGKGVNNNRGLRIIGNKTQIDNIYVARGSGDTTYGAIYLDGNSFVRNNLLGNGNYNISTLSIGREENLISNNTLTSGDKWSTNQVTADYSNSEHVNSKSTSLKLTANINRGGIMTYVNGIDGDVNVSVIVYAEVDTSIAINIYVNSVYRTERTFQLVGGEWNNISFKIKMSANFIYRIGLSTPTAPTSIWVDEVNAITQANTYVSHEVYGNNYLYSSLLSTDAIDCTMLESNIDKGTIDFQPTDLTTNDYGFLFFDNTNKRQKVWNGTEFRRLMDVKDVATVGNSSEIPGNLVYNDKGFMYFNTTLKKPIWWDGSKWVDATGTQV